MRAIKFCLNKQLTSLCQKSLALESLQTKIVAYLPTVLQDKCVVTSFDKGCLVLTTDDAVWANPLRFALPELRDTLRQQAGLYQLVSISVKVREIHYTKPRPSSKPKSLPMPAQNAFKALSENCDYLPLQAVLRRLGGKV